MLSSVPKHKKVVICFTEKMPVLDELSSGMSYGTIGYEFCVNESTTKCIQKKEEEICCSVHEAAL